MLTLLVLGLLVGASPTGAAAAHTVTVDFTAIDHETLGDSAINRAYKSLLVRLVEEGLSVADPAQGGDIMVRVTRADPRNLHVFVETAKGKQERKVRFGEDAAEQAEFLLMHATLDLVRSAHAELLAPAPGLPPPASRSRAAGVQVGGAMLWSGTSAGAMASGDAVLNLGPVRLALGLVAHQPLQLPSGLHLYEWGALAGARVGTHALAPWLFLEAALAGGFLQERYRYSDAAGNSDAGALLDPLGMGCLGATLLLGHGFGIGLDGGMWLTLHQRTLRSTEGILWRGPQVRPLVGLRLEYLR
jgi:hypothetical protein